MKETAAILLDLFVLFAAAKILGELFELVKAPEVVGELLGGMIVGPHVLGLVDPEGGLVLDVIAELGVIILLFTVGLETNVGELRRMGRQALGVGVLGVALPLAAGAGLLLLVGRSTNESLFLGAALAATSIGITARVLRDLGAVRTNVARVVLGAAVVDDILAILVLTVVAGSATGEGLSVAVVASFIAVGVFLAIVVLAGPRAIRGLFRLSHTPLVPRSPFLFAVLLTLGLAGLSGIVGLASVIGAFLAGLIFDFSLDEVERDVRPVYDLFVPFFFAITGARLDPTVFARPEILGLVAAVTLVAVLTKVGAGWLGALGLPARLRVAVGVGMMPRGEVALIVASLALGLEVIGGDLFAVVLAMAVITTIAMPPLMARLLRPEVEALR